MNPMGQLPAETSLSTFSTDFKQNTEFQGIHFKMSRIQSKITQHIKNQEIFSSHEKKNVEVT